MTKSEDNRIISVPVMSKYEFFQGTAMQQPSYIVVENIQIHSVVTQEEEDVHHHPQQPPNNTTREELSIFKYAKTVDVDSSNNNPVVSAIAENINTAANNDKKKYIIDDDAVLEKEAADVDLFKSVEDDEIWEKDAYESDDDDVEDVQNELRSDTGEYNTPPAAAPPPPPKKDYRYHKHRGIVSFTLVGRIEIDSVERIEL